MIPGHPTAPHRDRPTEGPPRTSTCDALTPDCRHRESLYIAAGAPSLDGLFLPVRNRAEMLQEGR